MGTGSPRRAAQLLLRRPDLEPVAIRGNVETRLSRVGADLDAWGLDHGTWGVLVHAFPEADIPVVQLSLDARKPLDWHLRLGAKLAALRARGVLVVGSGNVVHNLRAIDWRQPDAGFDWARRFDEDARVLMRERPQDIASMAGLKVLPQIGVYCMSKAAVVQMTKAMALEWGRFGINVNAICPGYIDTEINHHHWQTEQGQKLISMLPRKRVGEPKDLDAVLMMLASDQSHFVNGAVIAADDGFAV